MCSLYCLVFRELSTRMVFLNIISVNQIRFEPIIKTTDRNPKRLSDNTVFCVTVHESLSAKKNQKRNANDEANQISENEGILKQVWNFVKQKVISYIINTVIGLIFG